ncbi:Major facilitator transporter-like protein [Mycena kentingensis (nom. inval.)]|nr:Major facilitator transporter-like protein [Mycena kentingensis (nom. inval.)]
MSSPSEIGMSSEHDSDTKTITPPAAEDMILTGTRLALVFGAMMLSLFLLALDQTILATALPRIASEFNAFTLQGWVATSFIIAQTVFLLFYGQLLSIFPAEWVLIATVAIFEAGSLVCGLAQDVNQLIAGRTLSGVGAGGMYVAMIQVLGQGTRLEDRPRLFGLFGAVFGVASIVGPLLGGALTDHVRLFLRISARADDFAVIFLILQVAPPLGSNPNEGTPVHIRRAVLSMDYGGAILVAGFVCCLVIALQWGGNTKPWNSVGVIVCFVLAAVLAIATVLWEIHLGSAAMCPPKIFKSRSIYAIAFFCFFTRFLQLQLTYYIPLWFQAAKNHSATRSGLDLLAFMLSTMLTLIILGIVIGRVGRYQPFLVVAPCFLALACGLLYYHTSRDVDSAPIARMTGFQILAGLGIGAVLQNGVLAIQVEFKDAGDLKLLAQAASMVTFAQFLGGALGLATAEPVFATMLARNLRRYAPEVPPDLVEVIKQSPTSIHSVLPQEMVAHVVTAYSKSISIVFLVGVPVAGIALVLALFINDLRIEKAAPTQVEDSEKKESIKETV